MSGWRHAIRERNMLRFFERLVDPYPDQPESVPADRLWPFVLHYSRPFTGLLAAMAVVTALVSIAEVVFFTAMGELVDWLAEADREGFCRHPPDQLDRPGSGGAGRTATSGVFAVVDHPPGNLRQLPHARALALPSADARAEPVVLS